MLATAGPAREGAPSEQILLAMQGLPSTPGEAQGDGIFQGSHDRIALRSSHGLQLVKRTLLTVSTTHAEEGPTLGSSLKTAR